MFSANENIVLRQHKRRITEYVESTIKEEVLEAGTSVMAMQVSCKAPGCVPLETVICVIFPRVNKPLIKGLVESSGGTFKATVLKPMADVTREDVLDALPPTFEGGRWSFESQCLVARDVVLNQITKTVQETEGRQLMAQYVIEALRKFIQNKCIPPEPGQEFEEVVISHMKENEMEVSHNLNSHQRMEKDLNTIEVDTSQLHGDVAKSAIDMGSGNFVIRRASQTKSSLNQPVSPLTRPHMKKSQSDWRQQQRQTMGSMKSESSMIQRLAEREGKHSRGLRRPGCPCCDPENPSNVIDQMIGGML